MTQSYDPVIADAKRRARRHAREAGIPYQTALDRIARSDGHVDWAGMIATPRDVPRESVEAVPGPVDRGMAFVSDPTRQRLVTVMLMTVMASLTITVLSLADRVGLQDSLPFTIPSWLVTASQVVDAAFGLAVLLLVASTTRKALRHLMAQRGRSSVDARSARAALILAGFALFAVGIVLILFAQPIGLAFVAAYFVPTTIGRVLYPYRATK
jgi:hypothetical protein